MKQPSATNASGRTAGSRAHRTRPTVTVVLMLISMVVSAVGLSWSPASAADTREPVMSEPRETDDDPATGDPAGDPTGNPTTAEPRPTIPPATAETRPTVPAATVEPTSTVPSTTVPAGPVEVTPTPTPTVPPIPSAPAPAPSRAAPASHTTSTPTVERLIDPVKFLGTVDTTLHWMGYPRPTPTPVEWEMYCEFNADETKVICTEWEITCIGKVGECSGAGEQPTPVEWEWYCWDTAKGTVVCVEWSLDSCTGSVCGDDEFGSTKPWNTDVGRGGPQRGSDAGMSCGFDLDCAEAFISWCYGQGGEPLTEIPSDDIGIEVNCDLGARKDSTLTIAPGTVRMSIPAQSAGASVGDPAVAV
jgi:hypothetical protein